MKLKPSKTVVVFTKNILQEGFFPGVSVGDIGLFVKFEEDPDWDASYLIRYTDLDDRHDGEATFTAMEFETIGEL